MSIEQENLFPGTKGMTFKTNVANEREFKELASSLQKLPEIKDITFNSEKMPHEITILVHEVISLHKLQDAARYIDYHLIPRGVLS
jgi:hypothetical protein